MRVFKHEGGHPLIARGQKPETETKFGLSNADQNRLPHEAGSVSSQSGQESNFDIDTGLKQGRDFGLDGRHQIDVDLRGLNADNERIAGLAVRSPQGSPFAPPARDRVDIKEIALHELDSAALPDIHVNGAG